MRGFEYCSPVRIKFGENIIEQIGCILAGKYHKALLVMSKGPFRENGVYEKIRKSLQNAGIELIEMSDIDSNPKLSSVYEGMRTARYNIVDCIVAVGGGSAIDCAKVIGASAKTGIDPYDYLWGNRIPIEDSFDVVTVPTIAATGSEVNPYAVIVHDDTKEKYYCETPHPAISIMDPSLTSSVPLKLTIWGAMDILSHTFEFYFNGDTNSEFQLRFSEAIILATMNAVDMLVATPFDLRARGELMWCAVMAWGGLTKIGRGDPDMVCHGLEESFSGWFNTHHGACLGVLTPRWMKLAAAEHPTPFARFARNVFSLDCEDEATAANYAVKKYQEWLKKIGAPNTYFDIGTNAFELKDLVHVAKTACKIYGGTVGRLKKFNESESLELLKMGKEPY